MRLKVARRAWNAQAARAVTSPRAGAWRRARRVSYVGPYGGPYVEQSTRMARRAG